MAITPTEASKIAKKFGLDLPAARALSAMAEDAEDAEEIAKMFGTETKEGDISRDEAGKIADRIGGGR